MKTLPLTVAVARAPSKPSAIVTVDPTGPRGGDARSHHIHLRLDVAAAAAGDAPADGRETMNIARRALAPYAPEGRQDPRSFSEVSARRGKPGSGITVVVAIEGSVECPTRPTDDTIEHVRVTLTDEGYRVTVRERRECGEPACSSDALVAWLAAEVVPSGWFSAGVCGRHSYRLCRGCQSVFELTSTNSAGQAPSVHCEVCGQVLVEWGSSKVWLAALVRRVEPVAR